MHVRIGLTWQLLLITEANKSLVSRFAIVLCKVCAF